MAICEFLNHRFYSADTFQFDVDKGQHNFGGFFCFQVRQIVRRLVVSVFQH